MKLVALHACAAHVGGIAGDWSLLLWRDDGQRSWWIGTPAPEAKRVFRGGATG